MATATTEPASASLVSLAFSAHCQLALPLALEMDSASPSALRWLVFAMRVTRVMTARRRPAPMIAVATDNASMESAHVRMALEELTAPLVAPVTDNVAVVTESVLRESAIATLAGPVTLATFAPACTIAPTMAIAATVPASAKRVTAAVTALFHLSPNPANARFTAFVDACNSAPRFTRPRVLAPPTSATQDALKSAFPNVSLERCQ